MITNNTKEITNMKTNTLYYGDCMEVMSAWPNACVDLIYLDPPFNSKVNYNIIFGKQRSENGKDDLAQLTAFTDTWEWDTAAAQRVQSIMSAVTHPAHRAIRAFSEIYPDGSGMLSYLSYMAQRLAEMPRLLKDTGSIYLHCDQTASHYLKLIMDEVFGKHLLRNEIIWSYQGTGQSKKAFKKKHDTILFYTKSDDSYFSEVDSSEPVSEFSKSKFTKTDAEGKYKEIRHKDGFVHKQYLRENQRMRDVWEIPIINAMAKERLGYPTQKPLALLKRIIAASSNEGDVVVDPFCGCGTTIEAAHLLKRKWVGIDISAYAIEVVRRERMKDLRINLAGVPKDLKGAMHFAQQNPFDFEKWAVTRIPGFAPNTVQRGDGGIDGRALIYAAEKGTDLCIAQVKGGKPNIDSLRAFLGVIASGKAAIGVFITLEKWDTAAVNKCIAQSGVLKRGATEFKRLVMYTIDEYFQGIEPKLPPLAHPRTGEAFHKELESKSLLDE